MEKKEKRLEYKGMIILCIFMGILALSYISFILYSYFVIKKYDYKILPQVYLEEYNLSNTEFSNLVQTIQKQQEKVLTTNIILVCQGKEYSYHLKDLGLSFPTNQVIEEILDYQDSLSYSEKVMQVFFGKKKKFSYAFSYDKEKIRNFLTQLKQKVDLPLVHGSFSEQNGKIQYLSGHDSYSLNVLSSLEVLTKKLDSGVKENEKIELIGTSEKSNHNPAYAAINTKVSSFSTEFNPYISRATNLKTALNYINGAVVEPGQIFSFYQYAGPYDKKGYVFYYEFVGNGVCQIATTVYNAVLLGGLKVVKRYPHAAKSVYVAGGLDATVASYSSGWNVDFQFQNTYSYPIYIRAYANGGTAVVELWSNQNAMEGKTYQTESVQIGTRGYTTYLHTYQNGVEIKKEKIATTWYTKD